MAGYSGTPLFRKLGIKEGMSVGVFSMPASFRDSLGDLPDGAHIHTDVVPSDIFIVFGEWADDIEGQFHAAMAQIEPDGAIWVAWPKKSSGVATDLTENAMRNMFLPTGMVDNKVCAIDETWSGLRFVVRNENRADWSDRGHGNPALS